MFFIIQQETIGRDPVQNAIIMDVINHNRYSHSYELMSSMDFYKEFNDEETFSMQMIRKTPEDFDERFQNAIAIGTVRFIEQYLQTFKRIERDKGKLTMRFCRRQ